MEIFLDADACPVKEETYRVAARYGLKTWVVANAFIFVPTHPLIERVVVDAGPDAADDWIAGRVRNGDVVVTNDIPLAERAAEGRRRDDRAERPAVHRRLDRLGYGRAGDHGTDPLDRRHGRRAGAVRPAGPLKVPAIPGRGHRPGAAAPPMIVVTEDIALGEDELAFSFIRASGPGGQNVNKVSTAVQLRFDARRSPSLGDEVSARLQKLAGSRLTLDGVIVMTASRHRSQERNRAEVIERLVALVAKAATPPAKRRPTRPTKASKARRLEAKARRSGIKAARIRPAPEE